MLASNIIYVAGPATDADQARQLALQQGLDTPVLLRRRGTALGWIAENRQFPAIDAETAARTWRQAGVCSLPGFVADQLARYQTEIRQSLNLMTQVAEGGDVAGILDQSPYRERTASQFEMLASFQDESDAQEIETIEYDAVANGTVTGENLWCKASWLSFDETDASLRFRFSFGLAGYEDVAADIDRQHLAAQLTEAIFPESAIISCNPALDRFLRAVIGVEKLAYVERIIYFNAPNGGAQFHQDVERGHLGVVFAQAYGRTGWLACSKAQLLNEIQAFVADPDNLPHLIRLLPDQTMLQTLTAKYDDREQLNRWLDEPDNDALEYLLNHCPEFCRQLVTHGHGYIINPGDIILLPQKSIDECAWHTVFCLDDHPGEALSFAVRSIETQ